jgi:hypothetical protein
VVELAVRAGGDQRHYFLKLFSVKKSGRVHKRVFITAQHSKILSSMTPSKYLVWSPNLDSFLLFKQHYFRCIKSKVAVE